MIPGATLSVEKSKFDASSGDLCRFEHYIFFFGFFKVNLRSVNGLGGLSDLKQSCSDCPENSKTGLTFFLRSFFYHSDENTGTRTQKNREKHNILQISCLRCLKSCTHSKESNGTSPSPIQAFLVVKQSILRFFFLIFWNLVGNFEGYPCTILVELEGCLFSII